MKKMLVVLLGILAFSVYAATPSVDSNGSPPASKNEMVSLYQATSCKASVRFTDGGIITAGTLTPYYFDDVIGMYEGAEYERCPLNTSSQIDGGSRRSQACVWSVEHPIGWVRFVLTGTVGQNPTVRSECNNPRI
jgi:hypothetical protein